METACGHSAWCRTADSEDRCRPATWMTAEVRQPIPAVIHQRYDFELPPVPVMTLEETLSEKVARLQRLSTAR